MIINHNLSAMNAHRNMGINNTSAGKSMEKLSSGLRINRAGDDAAGLAISEKMRGQIRGLDQASRNSQDAISLLQTGEGALNETHSILQRMRELAVQGASDTNVAGDRTAISTEMSQLKLEIDRISTTTEFNTRKLLNGDLSVATAKQAQILKIASGTMKASAGTVLTVSTKFSVLNDSQGNTLGIAVGDVISIRGTKGNSIVCATVNVTAGKTISSILAAVKAATVFDFKSATLAAGVFQLKTTTGANAAVGALTITAASSTGAERTAFNNAFGNIAQTQTAQNAAANGSTTMQIGANATQTISIDINKMDQVALGVNAVAVGSSTAAQTSITAIDAAMVSVSTERSKLGAFQNRLEHTIANLNTSSENLQSSESRIRDVDMAKEMMNFSKTNILSQAAQAMLAQANQQPQGVLQLLR